MSARESASRTLSFIEPAGSKGKLDPRGEKDIGPGSTNRSKGDRSRGPRRPAPCISRREDTKSAARPGVNSTWAQMGTDSGNLPYDARRAGDKKEGFLAFFPACGPAAREREAVWRAGAAGLSADALPLALPWVQYRSISSRCIPLE